MVDWKKIEQKWQKKWDEARLYERDPDPKKKKCFVTFPYPYLNGPLHLGHALTATQVDIYNRYKLMNGYNSLWPFAFHATGEPIVGVAKRVKEGEEKQISILIKGGIPKEEVEKFSDPEYIVEYYKNRGISSIKRIGFSVDWRRKFTTIEPRYKQFIRWQYLTLKDLGYVRLGTHPVIWCPNCLSPTGDHDRLVGEQSTPVEFTLLKFYSSKRDAYFVPGTLRPETIFGVVAMWIHPKAKYVKVDVNGEKWIVSKATIQKLIDQNKKVKVLEEYEGKEFIGETCTNPLLKNEVMIIPAWYEGKSFVDAEHTTGVVMSVPSHAPFDWIAQKDLRDHPEISKEFGLDPEIIEKLEPISLIETEGLGEHPAIDIVERMGIKNQLDPKTEKATSEIYKKEFHKGILKENTGKYKGTPVREIKDILIADFKELGIADSLWETSDIVICRCNTRNIIKILENQWFLTYGDPEWKAKVHHWLETKKVFPDEGRAAFAYTFDWLMDKACVRRSGLGTPLPWDEDWIVETLSDSTIYMSYYTIAKYIYDEKNNITPENLTRELFDYIFLNKGKLKNVAKKSGISEDLITQMREEFLYWYPMDLRNSAKELIYNHLSFCIFQHTAIWPEEMWPQAIGVNGMIQVEGGKMSKSRGMFITMDEALEKYGADATRMELGYITQGLNDPDWRARDLDGIRRRIDSFYSFATSLSDLATEHQVIDNWLLSQIHKRIKNATRHYERLQTRLVVQESFFSLFNDIRWYQRRTKQPSDVLRIAAETMVKLMAPIIPHVCEEIWEIWGHDDFIFNSDWPTADETLINEDLEKGERFLSEVLDDLREIIKLTKKTKPEKVQLFIAQEWKYKVYNEALQNKKDLMKRVMKDPAMRKMGKEVSKYAGKLMKIPDLESKQPKDRELELGILSESIDFIKKEINAGIVQVIEAEKSNHQKAKVAEPGKPGIFIE
ncbi:MAG: leucine--tRNA ligase [Candidatus Helarchaeota archaeon]